MQTTLPHMQNFNPRSPCGERRHSHRAQQDQKGISIHAPRAGSDCHYQDHRRRKNISIHAPRAGSDYYEVTYNGDKNISIHAPRAGSDPQGAQGAKGDTGISIHAPRAGSDPDKDGSYRLTVLFQSTLPVRGATMASAPLVIIFAISIHAPRAGSDHPRGARGF